MNLNNPSVLFAGGRTNITVIRYALIGVLGYVLGFVCNDNTVHPSQQGHSRQLEDTESTNLTEDHEESSDAYVTIITCIVLMLIVLTIAFEYGKELLEEHATRHLLPLVEKLFGEMTVLGFLSVVTFCITQTGWFTILSQILFGKEDELLEIFEFVHFTIFFIMIAFVGQVVLLGTTAIATEQTWVDMDQILRDPILQEQNTSAGAYTNDDNGVSKRQSDLLLFQALRDEFILERTARHPFDPTPETHRVSNDFNFGRYLGINQGTLLAHVVEVTITSWAFFGLMTVIYYLYVVAVTEDITTLTWTWVTMGWIVYVFNILFERHLIQRRKMFISKKILLLMNDKNVCLDNNDTSSSHDLNSDETTYLKEKEDPTLHLPLWTDVASKGGDDTNRLHSIYWLNRRGPWLYLHLLQGNLLFVGIYGAMNILSFIPYMFHATVMTSDKDDANTNVTVVSFFSSSNPVLLLIGYLILVLLPLVLIVLKQPNLVCIMSQVCCMGAHRRPNIVERVVREEKAACVVRTFLILYQIRMLQQQQKQKKKQQQQQQEHDDAGGISLHRTTTTTKATVSTKGTTSSRRRFNRMEVAGVFEVLDHDGKGSIELKELERLMKSVFLVGAGGGGNDEGSTTTTTTTTTTGSDEVHQMMEMLDKDGRRDAISKDDFLDWYNHVIAKADDDDDDDHVMTNEERGKLLFSMFDKDHSGEITIAEFQHFLIDTLNVGFTMDDVGALVNELDHDNSGTIGPHEFAHLIQQYYPK